ncbi:MULTISPECIES: hypothetical protein [Acidobacteriaceae]|uniref:hypothetical protein n=1 Tax=Acidobacteriaceae TaxID=204434 RepID=UPI00131C1578|nr:MULTISPECIES: hypothetical protein [Acidobacteriaceae]MDW5264793.1 hypothetical protein [Edaphobacter sp.]
MSRYISWLLLLGIAMVPVTGRAQTSCPWLNNATASGVLNAAASLKMQSTADNGSVCLFQYQEGSTVYDLQIVVHDIKSAPGESTADESRCRSHATLLKGIGNEAILCPVNSEDLYGEQVIGRVRDKKFIVSVGSNLRMNRAVTLEALQLKATGIAEQVAGSLF